MKKTTVNLVPDITNPSPDYYCTWQTQLYATSDGKPEEQRRSIGEKGLFDTRKPYGWAYFYEQVRQDLFLVMDDSWDVPLSNDTAYYGSLILSRDKFPHFTQNTDNGLKALSEKVRALGWKGLGGWVCAQESPLYTAGKTVEEYWIERLKAAAEAEMSYWKVDWGAKSGSFAFRRMLTELAGTHAPGLLVEHSMIADIVPYAHTFRTYDVPALMSIPMTLEKIVHFANTPEPADKRRGIINCEDEAYIAAAGGYAMGIMRHPYAGALPDGRADMSFPEIHRNLKTKMYEVIRAARWHRIAPAFGGGEFTVSDTVLSDTWKLEKPEEEFEAWWLCHPMVGGCIEDGRLTKTAPACIARNTALPHVLPNEDGIFPYCVAAGNPNGVYSVATLGRTTERMYGIPRCDVTVNSGDADTVGVFGEYNTLTLETTKACKTVLMQDLAGDTAHDITEHVQKGNGRLIVPGELISNIGTESQPDGDTSEPGVVIKLYAG